MNQSILQTIVLLHYPGFKSGVIFMQVSNTFNNLYENKGNANYSFV